jgi:hypothetical protein
MVIFYAGASALSQSTPVPSATPQGYVPPATTPTGDPYYATLSALSSSTLFYVNGTSDAQVYPGQEVILVWSAPLVSQVWIETRTSRLQMCPGTAEFPTQESFGPLPAEGALRYQLPADETEYVRFELYVDNYGPFQCGQSDAPLRGLSVQSVSAWVTGDDPTATPLPNEYFIAGSSDSPQLGQSIIVQANYGEFVTLSWKSRSSPVYIQALSPNQEQLATYGPLPSTGQLQLCAEDGSSFTLYAAGKPGEVQGKTIGISQYISPSTSMQLFQSGFVPCWGRVTDYEFVTTTPSPVPQ